METTSVSLEFAGKTMTFEIGRVAQQATSAVLARLGDTMVLATVVEGAERTDIDYFPLSVEYVERLYAGGKIKGSRWVKREGRPSDEAILTGRLIDRSIRPLFPKEYKKDVQVVVTVLSVDAENQPDILALNAVSAALAISPIPWKGPVGAIRMGLVKDQDGNSEFILNPTLSEMELSELDLVSSQTQDQTIMLEAGARQVPENLVAESIKFGHEETKKMIVFINDLAKKIGQPKIEVKPNTPLLEAAALIEKSFKKEITDLAQARADKEGGGPSIDDLVNSIIEHAKLSDPTNELDKKLVAQAIEKVMFKFIRKNVVEKQKRLDGRKIDELRPLSVEVGVLPRTHGSAIFARGATQALTVATLGSPRMSQIIESAEGEENKRYIHHYSMPPYSVGSTGRMGTPSRREIGHGALAERALEPVIPDGKKFPYTIRVVSEIMSSNGSTSMASTCGSTLALMDAGVPIESPVAGISIGMMSDEENYVLLTDIIGMEDFSGDMDFKVAGTDKGVTAIQLDVKRPITQQQIEETFVRARTARMAILEKMHAAIPEYRKQVSEYAPKIELIQIPVDKIGEVIGPGGRNIKNIIATTGADVDIEDDGTVTVSGISEESVDKAAEWIKGMTREVTPGEVFEGEVKRILPFGAFVEYLPGREGMVHVSKMKRGFVKSPDEVVSIGDKVTVKIEEIDQQGRINLTMLLDDEGGNEPREPRGGFGGNGGRDQGTHERVSRRSAGPSSDHPLSRQLQREQREKAGFPRKRFR
jgi:polyribonucleotide nucleotidyltransferase